MNQIEDGSIDMILTDLPYGVTKNKWDKILPFEQLWAQYNRVIKENGAIVLFAQAPFNAKLIMSNLKNFKYEWIYQKTNITNFLNAKKQPMRNHENIVVFYKKQATYNPQFDKGKPYKAARSQKTSNYGEIKPNFKTVNNGTRYPKSIIKFNNSNQKKKKHPTEKPVELLEYLIKTYTNEGETVLDSCMGGLYWIGCYKYKP